ncbi:MAG: hypothetical protein HZB36_00810 [Candidatus Omnitrophica bacterium]|nr:hypothetical protein [Candidatus Omnitrophota bacterium]
MRKYTEKIILLVLLAGLFLSNTEASALAKEVKIAFTGQAYSMLYPCSCPHEPDGGVARREALFKKLRADSQDIIFVETGSSFASGPQDQYAKDQETDSRRTEIYLSALGLMGYDALLAGNQEYVFGQEFLERYRDLPFISSNIEGFSRAYVMKDLGWIKVGILGLTDNLTLPKGVSALAPSSVLLAQRVAELKKRGAGLVVLLSNLDLQADQNIVKNVRGIDVIINGTPSFGTVNMSEIQGVIHLTTWWEARRVGVLTLEISRGAIVGKNLESIRLSSDIPGDEAVSRILPQCFVDGDCKKMPGLLARCENATKQEARCVYINPGKVSLTVIIPRICRTCRVEEVLKSMQSGFGEMSVRYLFEDESQAQAIIKEFGLTMLPAYLFPVDFEKSEYFTHFKSILKKGSEFYLANSEKTGVSYLLRNIRATKRLDVVFGFDKAASPELFKMLKVFCEKHKDIDVRIHLLAIPDKDKKGNFLARGADASELEELNRIACIDSAYPGKTFDYLVCRSQSKVGRWDECLPGLKIDRSKIKNCAVSQKAMAKYTKLTQELKIASGPTFIIDNKEIFSIINIPSLEEFESFVFGKEKSNNGIKRGRDEKTK